MLLGDELVKLKWVKLNKEHFESLGYKFESVGASLVVKASELTPCSKVKVAIKCDYCGEVYSNTYQNYLKSFLKHGNSYCTKCKKFRLVLDFSVVKAKFEAKGYTVLDTVYVNANTNINYICSKHPDVVQDATYATVYMGGGCYYCGLESRSKENHHNWQGGISTQNTLERTSPEYKEWRLAVLDKDDYTCHKCGSHRNLNAHHILNFSTHKDLRYDVNNGITFCRDCHSKKNGYGFHSIYGNKNNTREQVEDYLTVVRSELAELAARLL